MDSMKSDYPGNVHNNPITFYIRSLLYMFLALLIRLLTLLPLGALLIFPAESPWRWAALLCPVLILFVVLPLRFSFAQTMVRGEDDRRFSFDVAMSLSDYGEKLGESLLHALHLLLWGIPLIGMLLGVRYYYNNVDMITLMQGISDTGAAITTVLYGIANFFIGIFNGTLLVPNGGLMEGLYTVLAVLGVGVLILLWGMVRNGAFRFVWALALKTDKSPHAEARRRLRGRRWKQMGVAMINLLLWAPALYITITTMKDVLGNVSDALFNLVSTEQLDLPEMTGAIKPLLFAFFVCYMPLLPIRRALTSYFAVRHIHHAAAPAAPVEEEYHPEPNATGAMEYTAQSREMPAMGTGRMEEYQPQPVQQPVPQPVPVAAPVQTAVATEPVMMEAEELPVEEAPVQETTVVEEVPVEESIPVAEELPVQEETVVETELAPEEVPEAKPALETEPLRQPIPAYRPGQTVPYPEPIQAEQTEPDTDDADGDDE